MLSRRNKAEKVSRPPPSAFKSNASSPHISSKTRRGKLGVSYYFLGFFLVFIAGVVILNSVGSSNKNGIHVPPSRPTNNVLINPMTTSQAPLKADDGYIYHTIFSTDCSEFQHWQSYLFFHAAMKVKQPGYVTRIASGCKEEELENEKNGMRNIFSHV